MSAQRQRIRVKQTDPPQRQRQRVKPIPLSDAEKKTRNVNAAANRNAKGHFGQGNHIWRYVTPGCPRIFQSPEDMWEKACEYFEWRISHPWKEQRIASDRGEPIHVDVDKLIPFTLSGFWLFANITDACWYAYANDRPEFTRVCKQIMEIIKTQKFEGAASGFFNHAIIARDLGLADKKELSAPDGQPLIPPEQGDMRAKNMRAVMLAALSVMDKGEDE